jgi:hypothetical protein
LKNSYVIGSANWRAANVFQAPKIKGKEEKSRREVKGL